MNIPFRLATNVSSDWLEGLDLSSTDVIVANPPYIPKQEYDHLDGSVVE